MPDWSEIRFARSRDGRHLAYQEAGDGSPLLLLIEGFVPIEDMDSEPRLARPLRSFTTFSRTIRLDRSGIGSSDAVGMTQLVPSLEGWVEDAEAVLDEAGVEDAFVFGDRGGALIAIALAAWRPSRIRGLILVNGFARSMARPDHPQGADPAFMAEVRERLYDPSHPAGPFDIIDHLAPSAADDIRFRAWWDRSGRRGASPATARALRRLIEDADVRHLLGDIYAPTIVMHRRDAATPRFEQGRHLADHITAARFVPLEGPDSVWYVGDTDPIVREIEAFVVGSAGTDQARDEIRTILFVDIVQSTARAAEMGDRAWVRVFDAFELAALHAVAENGGAYVKSTGDGALALFDDASSAVVCGAGLRNAADALGLQVRVGLHTGSVELVGRDVSGIAVNTAARVLDAAGPDQVLLTTATADLLEDRSSLVHVGERRLRGVPGSWDLFTVEGRGLRPSSALNSPESSD